ncbi:MAG: hybrid sensor histidine kinase/response regulator [Thermoleophilia bacterium]
MAGNDPAARQQLPDALPRRGWVLRAAIFLFAIAVMGNLDALVDVFEHRRQPYFDTDHLIVGGLAILATSLLLGGIWVYFDRLQRASADSRRARQASHENQEKYLQLFESSLDMVFICSPMEKFEDINPAGVRLLGYGSREEVMAIDVGRDLHASLADWAEYQRLMLQNGCVDNFEHELKRKDGKKIWVVESSTAIFDADDNLVGCRGIVRDVSEHRRLESELLTAQKMESIGRLAGAVAHDFTNHITSIQGNIDLVLMGAPNGPMRENLQAARLSAEQAAGLTRQLMLLSQRHPLEVHRIDVNELLARMKDMLRLLAGEHVSLSTGLSADPAVIEAEPNTVQQMVINLVAGAREAMPGGGAVSIRTANVSMDEESAQHHEDAYPGDFLTIAVRNAGDGFNEKTAAGSDGQDRYGDTCQSSRAGVRMPVVYAAALQHRGWVEFENLPVDGCSATIYLPLAPVAAGAAVEADRESMLFQGNRERLLLVEDDEPVRITAEKILRENGYKVYAAADAREAFNIFVNEKGDFDLLFSDVVLPGETGIDLAEQLASFKPQLPVLLASGYSDTALDWDMVKSRGYGFLQKPYALSNLLQAVRVLLVNLG